MSFDFKAFISGHPALTSAIDSLQKAALVAAEDAAKSAIGSIPAVGGIAETLSSPLLDGIERMVEAKVEAALQGLGLGTAPAVAPVAAIAAAPAALKAAAPSPGGDPRMAQKQADSAARAAATDIGQGTFNP